jgi:hypothetical protein
MVHIAPGHGWDIPAWHEGRTRYCLPGRWCREVYRRSRKVFRPEHRDANIEVLKALGDHLSPKRALPTGTPLLALQDPDHLPGDLPVVLKAKELRTDCLRRLRKSLGTPTGQKRPVL